MKVMLYFIMFHFQSTDGQDQTDALTDRYTGRPLHNYFQGKISVFKH